MGTIVPTRNFKSRAFNYIAERNGKSLPTGLSLPPRHRNPGACPGSRLNFKIVRQPLRAAEAQPQATAGSEAVLQCLVDVRNSGPAILEDCAQSATPGLLDDFDGSPAAFPVNQCIARDLAGRRHYFCLIHQREV